MGVTGLVFELQAHGEERQYEAHYISERELPLVCGNNTLRIILL